MAKYQVTGGAIRTITYWIDVCVEADSAEEAMTAALERDYDDYSTNGPDDLDWADESEVGCVALTDEAGGAKED